jgi:hypothetical protein
MHGHISIDTDALMGIANELAGFAETPADSTIYYPGVGIRKVLLGIDIGAGELLYARQYGFDAVIAHHPLGLVDAWRCFAAHVEQLVGAGVPREEATAAVAPRLEALALRAQAENFDRLTSLARLLDMPLLNIHQPLDEVGRRILQQTIDACLAHSAATLRDLADALEALPEFRAAPTSVRIALGEPAAPAGRVVMSHAAYTNGGAAVASAYFRHGVDTLAYIHLDPADLAPLRAAGTGQLLVTGHIASDAVGLNPYVARLEELGVAVVRISGALAG